LITGASSGIGRAIALQLAKPNVELQLWGRSSSRLQAVAHQARLKGATAAFHCIDLANAELLQQSLADLKAQPAPNEIYLAAGLSDIIEPDRILENADAARRVTAVNYACVVDILTALSPKVVANGGGRVAVIGSHAGLSALPYSPVYASSKAGLALYAKSLDMRLRPIGITVTLVSAGFVDTPMSRRLNAPKPFIISDHVAAARIIKACQNGKPHLVLSKPLYWFAKLANVLPLWLQRQFFRRLHITQGPWRE
jgi:short-subunit dehydrogenase